MRGLYLASVWLHILAAMTWAGGMTALVILVMPYFRRQSDAARAAYLEWFGPRFERVSWICFGLLALTGTFNLWARGVQASDFLRPAFHATPFGRLLILKLSLVGVAIVLSTWHSHPASRARARLLGRLLLVFGLAIIGVAVMMVRAI